MDGKRAPEWFAAAEGAIPEVLRRLAKAVDHLPLPIQIGLAPSQAFWFLAASMTLAREANLRGMHANALSITRQCLEAISIVELGLSREDSAAAVLESWLHNKETPGSIRKWLASHAWPSYGKGLWSESWSEFMSKLCKAVQPYAHYSSSLAQWQTRLHYFPDKCEEMRLILEFRPNIYDPQKATRITLYHGLIYFTLARIWIATSADRDPGFEVMADKLKIALGKSAYLDGDHTNWDEQFWAMMWFKDGNMCPE
jgi:hypothetical protein